jgi:hypothetical protein
MTALTEEMTPESVWEAAVGRPLDDDLLDWPPDVFAPAGFDLLSIARDPQRGVVRVDLVSDRGAEEARGYFIERYGDAVAVEWAGPTRYREVP